MARWLIRHLTTYRYSVEVRFAPHLLRLTPRSDQTHLITRRLSVWPEPVAMLEHQDAFGNSSTELRFGALPASELRIESHCELETPVARAPFATLAPPPPPLPWAAPADQSLAPFTGGVTHPDVLAFARSLAERVGGDALAFLELLTRELHARTERQLRVDGAAQPPEQTLATARGACRDLSVLHLAACRSLGMAGRFVSGYQGQEQTRDGRRHLHAWSEIWLPERGFMGWDPMYGVATGPGHVALAVAPDQAQTMPIEGGYYFDGPSLTSTLDYAIEMEPV